MQCIRHKVLERLCVARTANADNDVPAAVSNGLVELHASDVEVVADRAHVWVVPELLKNLQKLVQKGPAEGSGHAVADARLRHRHRRLLRVEGAVRAHVALQHVAHRDDSTRQRGAQHAALLQRRDEPIVQAAKLVQDVERSHVLDGAREGSLLRRRRQRKAECVGGRGVGVEIKVGAARGVRAARVVSGGGVLAVVGAGGPLRRDASAPSHSVRCGADALLRIRQISSESVKGRPLLPHNLLFGRYKKLPKAAIIVPHRAHREDAVERVEQPAHGVFVLADGVLSHLLERVHLLDDDAQGADELGDLAVDSGGADGPREGGVDDHRKRLLLLGGHTVD